MNIPAHDIETKQHNLRDWLDLHGLDHEMCLHLLGEIRRASAEIPAYRNDPEQQSLSIDPDHVWMQVTSAMCEFLPERQAIIAETFQRSKKIAIAGQGKSGKALTMDNGPNQYPTIMYNHVGEISDLFVVAHEFGHALQIVACEGQFMPPIMREVCAFLSEGAMLSSIADDNSIFRENMLAYWVNSNRRYFGSLAINLQRSFKNDQVIYEYGWNYPIARFLALKILDNFSQNLMWEVYSGAYTVKRALDQLAK